MGILTPKEIEEILLVGKLLKSEKRVNIDIAKIILDIFTGLKNIFIRFDELSILYTSGKKKKRKLMIKNLNRLCTALAYIKKAWNFSYIKQPQKAGGMFLRNLLERRLKYPDFATSFYKLHASSNNLNKFIDKWDDESSSVKKEMLRIQDLTRFRDSFNTFLDAFKGVVPKNASNFSRGIEDTKLKKVS